MNLTTTLTQRSAHAQLTAHSEPAEVTSLLKAESAAATWRLVEVFSAKGLPFELSAVWSGGAGAIASARCTVAHATRLCLFARSLELSVRNLSSQANQVGVTVADGFAPTSNLLELSGSCDGLTALQLPIPPFARTFSLQVADRTLLPGTVIDLVDGQGLLRGQLTAALIPAGGLPLGDVSRIDVLTARAAQLAGIFTLSI